MSRGPAAVTQANIARAIRAVEQTDARRVVEILPDGTIRIVPDDGRNRFQHELTYTSHGLNNTLDNETLHRL